MSIKLIELKDISESVSEIYQHVFFKLKELIPTARIEEIGSTSIPGAITKGDLDILVVVSEDVFPIAESELSKIYETNEMDKTPEFHSYKGVVDGIDLGIQLSTREDIFGFLTFRDLLKNSPDLVEQYNSIKKNSSHLTMDEYRVQKNLFICRSLDLI